MSLYTRLLGLDPDPNLKIPAHPFMSALGEVEKGKMTLAAVAAFFGLNASEQTELATLSAKIAPPVESVSLASRVTLTNLGTTPFILAGASIEGGGVTGAELRCFINRNGAASTLTFQVADATGGLANPTNIVTVTDTTGTGDKMISGIQTLAQPLSVGLRHLVFRANAGNATDDPILYGATLLIRRVNILIADVLHHVLILGETGVPGYATEAEMKARLGVP